MQGDTHAFIIRIWYEATDDEGNILAWRGSIEHVGSKNRRYFEDMDGIERFIQERTGIKTRQPRPKWKRLLARIWHERV